MSTHLPHVCPRIPGVPVPLALIDGDCAGKVFPPRGGGEPYLVSLSSSASQHRGDGDIAAYSLGGVLTPPRHQVTSALARRTTCRRRRNKHPRHHARIGQVPVSPQPPECAHHQRATHIPGIASATFLRTQEHVAIHASIRPAHHDGNTGVQAWRREEGRILLAQALAPNAQPPTVLPAPWVARTPDNPRGEGGPLLRARPSQQSTALASSPDRALSGDDRLGANALQAWHFTPVLCRRI